jgi:hypothetical protein
MFPTISELLKHKEALITVFSVVGATLFYFSYLIYRGRKYHLKELKALGLYQDETKDVMNEKTGLKERRVSSKIKVYWKGNKLTFSKYNRAYGIKNFENLKQNLETLFGKKIELITHEKQWWSSQPKIIIHTEAFPEKLLLSQRPKLNVGQLFLGVDALNRPVILETIKDFTNTVICLAPKGSGKSVLINGMITSFFETLEEHGEQDKYQLIIADNKGTDFIDVADRFKGSYYQPFNLKDLRELVGRLRQHKEEIEGTLEFLRANKISPRHWDELRTERTKFYLPPKLYLVIDEGKNIFGSGKQAPKLSKEPTADELARREKYELTQEFGHLVNFFAESCRSTGVIIIFASQSPNKSDYDYPDFLNFPVMILGQCNAQQSIQLIGDTSLNDNTLTRGKFVIRDEIGTRRFLAPLSIKIKGDGDGSK